ncbi:MAG: AbrB/MazE/SpoVT family DNA-binding domain-containing protein [Candidatus Freyarchaeota archaeon]
MMSKGTCSKTRIVYGVVTVSDKGQIAIPVDLRKELDIRQGDKLMVLKRKDDAGFTLLKLDMMDELMHNIQGDDEFFQKVKRGDKSAQV